MDEGCHAEAVREEDATFRAAGGVGSRIVMPLDYWGGVLVDASPEPGWVCSTMRGLFQVRLGEGRGRGVWAWAGEGCCCSKVWAPSTKRLIVITFLVNISNSAPEEWTDSTATSSSWAGASGSTGGGFSCSTYWCASSQRRRDTRSADSSLIGASSTEQV